MDQTAFTILFFCFTRIRRRTYTDDILQTVRDSCKGKAEVSWVDRGEPASQKETIAAGNATMVATNMKNGHNPNAGLKWPLSECRVRPPMRSDNLGPHLKEVHKMLSSSERQVIIDESKLLARRVDSDGIARRMSCLE